MIFSSNSVDIDEDAVDELDPSDTGSPSAPHNIQFPESFSRTSPVLGEEAMSDSSFDGSPAIERGSFSFSAEEGDADTKRTTTPARRTSTRGSVMRLEHILNDATIEREPHLRSRSLCTSPELLDPDVHMIIPSSAPAASGSMRSESPMERIVKKKKVKLHRCSECHKDFPRPSGLRTHMNMHTKEKPFACSYPGCTRTFSVVSNAKRHMRTHGMGMSSDDQTIEASTSVPYVVGFEAPVVVAPLSLESREPIRLRWVPAPPTPGEGSSSRGGLGRGSAAPLTPDEGDGTDDGDMERESASGQSSRHDGDDDEDKRPTVRRRVESDGSRRFVLIPRYRPNRLELRTLEVKH